MIVVTGATGHYGGKVVETLLGRLPASQLGISVRETEKADLLAARGVRVTKGNFTDPKSLLAAFEGAEQILIVSANSLGPEKIKLHENAIYAAKNAGVKRIVYTSHQAASPTSKVEFARDHAATERLLKASGVPFVALRNGFYAESLIPQLVDLKQTHKLTCPSEGPVSWTSRDDLAEAAAAVLMGSGSLDGVSPPLTCSRTYTFKDVAEIASALLGSEVTFSEQTIGAYKEDAKSKQIPPGQVAFLIGMFEAIRDREFDVIDPALEQILGRQPKELLQILSGSIR